MFEFVTAIKLEAAARVARGRAEIAAGHSLFTDHFPGEPTLPGSVAIELAAQIAGPLAEELAGDGRLAFLGMVRNAKLHQAVALPASLDIEARVEPLVSGDSDAPIPCQASVVIRRGGRKVATAELTLVLLIADAPALALSERATRLERWKAAW